MGKVLGFLIVIGVVAFAIWTSIGLVRDVKDKIRKKKENSESVIRVESSKEDDIKSKDINN